MLPFGEAEGEDRAGIQQGRSALLCRGVVALPDRPQAENGDLPDVPVLPAVEAEDVAHHRDAAGIPALVWISAALGRRREQRGEHPLPFQELDEVCIPDPFAVLFEKNALAALLEEGDRRFEDAPRFGVERGKVGGVGVEQESCVHGTGISASAGGAAIHHIVRGDNGDMVLNNQLHFTDYILLCS